MSLLDAFSFTKSIFDPITKLVDELKFSGEEKAEAKRKLQDMENQFHSKLLEHESKIVEAQSKVIQSEMQASKFSASWRPSLMYVIIAILANNYLIFPYLSMFTDKVIVLEFPANFWTLLTVGVGGYVGSRGLEKMVKSWKESPGRDPVL